MVCQFYCQFQSVGCSFILRVSLSREEIVYETPKLAGREQSEQKITDYFSALKKD
tara:strand:- start:850 stop:1014 length:165 start_codon:yes stop_codon:yes gene_type:complete